MVQTGWTQHALQDPRRLQKSMASLPVSCEGDSRQGERPWMHPQRSICYAGVGISDSHASGGDQRVAKDQAVPVDLDCRASTSIVRVHADAHCAEICSRPCSMKPLGNGLL